MVFRCTGKPLQTIATKVATRGPMTLDLTARSGAQVDSAVLDSYRDALNSIGIVREWRLDRFDRTGVPVAATARFAGTPT